ncbi:TRAP transporter substrate-binding protein DctP [Natronorubrum sp. A-ect3]|uniref:TRAP transporter substrate-binding protein DctP n=1 Tax=Natronorubrum sp. A-ect3 TaxID=3242698 RepID=UPI00359D0302
MSGNSKQSRREMLRTAGGITAVGSTIAIAGCTSLLQSDDEGSISDDELDELPEEEILYHHMSPADIWEDNHRAATTFKRFMEDATNQRFTVDIAPNNELAGAVESVEQCMEGAIEIAAGPTEGHLAPFFPDIDVLGVPYAFPSVDVGNYVMENEFGEQLKSMLADETGLLALGHHDNGGFRDFTANEPLQSPDDFEGLTIRNQDSAAHMEITRQLGANPEVVDWAELYEALDTGVVDGQENALPTMMAASLEEVQDYYIRDGHVFSMNFLLANEDWYSGLHPTYQRLVSEGLARASFDSQRVNRTHREYGFEYIQNEHGVEVYTPTEEEIDEFREATQEPVIDLLEDEMDNPGLIDELFDAIETAEEELGTSQYV